MISDQSEVEPYQELVVSGEYNRVCCLRKKVAQLLASQTANQSYGLRNRNMLNTAEKCRKNLVNMLISRNVYSCQKGKHCVIVLLLKAENDKLKH